MARGIRLILLIVFSLVAVAHSRGGFRGGGRGFSSGRGRGVGVGSGWGTRYAYSGTGFHGDRSAVRATSMARYNGGPTFVHISYFRGNGSGEESFEPLITSSVIYSSIFNKVASSSIFIPSAEPPQPPKASDPWDVNWAYAAYWSSQVGSLKMTHRKVVDISRPLTIGKGSLFYFWNASSLPRSNGSLDCFDYTTSNDGRNFSLCNVHTMDRCAANISDLPDFSDYTFSTTDGVRLNQFAWMCNEGQLCCAWECCDPPSAWTPLLITLVIVAAGILAFLAIVGLCVCCVKCYEGRKTDLPMDLPRRRNPDAIIPMAWHDSEAAALVSRS